MRDNPGLLSGRSQGYLIEAFNRLDDPIFIVDSNRELLFQNAAAGRVLKSAVGISVRSGVLRLVSADDNTHFDELLRKCRGTRGHVSRCGGLRFSSSTGGKDWFLLATLLTDVKAEPPAFVIQLARRVRPRTLPGAVMRDLFLLTRRDLLVIEQLMRGTPLRELAVVLNLTHETIRTYVKRIFHKCEVHSQGELIALVHRVSLFAPTKIGAGKISPFGDIGKPRPSAMLKKANDTSG